jgi:hypothetical protein
MHDKKQPIRDHKNLIGCCVFLEYSPKDDSFWQIVDVRT